MLRPTLRARIVLWNAIIVGLILALLGVASYQRVKSGVYHSIDQTLRNRSERLYGFQIADRNIASDNALLRAGHADAMAVLTRPRLLTTEGRSVTQMSSDKPWDREGFLECLQTGQPVYSESDAPEGQVRVYTRPLADEAGKVRLVMQHIYLLNEAEAAVTGVRDSFLAIAPLALLAIILGSFILAGRVADPIARMAAQANAITAEDLDKRLAARGDDEVAKLGRAFNNLLDRLASAFDQQNRVIESQRNFISDASNELRAPLEAIKSSVEAAISDGKDPRFSLEQIRKASAETDELVAQMLAMARADARLGDYSASHDVFPLLLDVYERWEPFFGERLTLQASRRLPAVRGDERQLKEVMDNVLQNCARYAPESAVTIMAEEAGQNVIIMVKDDGPGIAESDLPRVFDRFYRGRTEKHIQGTGLGLSIAREIVEAHQGSITATAREGQGTTIAISLPKSEEQVSAPA